MHNAARGLFLRGTRAISPGFPSWLCILAAWWCAAASAFAQVPGTREEEQDNPAEHLRWFFEQRAYPFDTIKASYRLDAYRIAQARAKSAVRAPSSALAWAPIGPAPAELYSGRIPALAVHPSDGNTAYIGAADGGVWKTTNGGASWTPLTDDQPSLASGCLAIDPVNPNVIYYGTGEPYNSIDSYGGAGVLKSTDGGATWALSGLTNEKRITRIAVNPVNPDILLAATWGGIYRSSNGGSSWTKTSSFSSGWDVAFDPSNPLICYAGASGVYKSTDGGLTWTHLTNGIPSSTARLALSVAQSSPSTVYVLVSNSTFYKTTDAGASWSSLPVPVYLFYGGQGWYDIALGVDPHNPTRVLIGGFDPYYSTDGGSSWTEIGGMHPDIHIFAFGPGVVYMGSDGGINRSTDGGATFTRVNNNLAITQFYTLGTSTMIPTEIWGGTQDNGTVSTTGSLAWSQQFPGDGGVVNIDDRNPALVYMELVNGVHYRSTDDGNFWTAANIGLGESGAWITPVVLHPDSTGVLWTATSKIYRSADSANHWQATNTSYPWGSSQIRQLAVPKTAPRTLYASPGASIYRSTDAGVTWTSVSAGLPGRTITSIVPHPTIPSRMYLTVSGSGTGHLFLSTDAGGSWSSISGNYPTDLPANSIAVDPSNTQTLYVGTDLGMWSSDDGGVTWMKDDGFPNTAVVMIGVTTDHFLVAATHGRSMFKAPLSAAPFIVVISPNGGETWTVGAVHSVAWSQSGIANVKLEYSTNAGSSWSTVAASVPASPGSYDWTVPNTVTSQGLVRISDAANASLGDTSNAVFAISPVPSVTVTSPNGGESWTAGSAHAITWSAANIANVSIGYSTNAGAAWNQIVATMPAAAGSYSWTVPNTPSTQALVRVTDASNALVSDPSNGLFTIVAAPLDTSITVSAPNGGETWIAVSSKNVTWTSASIANVAISYSTDRGASWIPVAGGVAASAGAYAWTVPNTPSAQALVRVSDAANAARFDTSNGIFTIAPPPSIALTSPNGGETWSVLSSHAVTWTATSIANAKIEYSTNGGGSWLLVVASTPAPAGSYTWSVPNTPTSSASVRVSDASNLAVRDSSDAVFAIAAAPAVTVLSPNGGETWTVGSLDTVTWASANIENVKIEYSTDNGSSWTLIAGGAPAAPGAYPWTVPNTPSTHSRVRISDATNSATNDQSNAAFTITAPTGVAVLSPNGGETWNVSSVHNITWSAGGLNNVKIRYSTNNGASWSTIVASTPASAGSYSWVVPNTPSAQARVQVGNASGSVSDMSDGMFTISAGAAAITLISPNGGEVWDTSSTQNIQWSSTGVSSVKIEYSTDLGATWAVVAAAAPDAPKAFVWNIPNSVTSQALVRISDASNAAVGDASDSAFTISLPPSIALLSPNGGEWMVAGSAFREAWASSGIATVRIEYSTDNGATWSLIEPGVPAASGSYAWLVPPTPTASGLVRVSDAINFVPSDRSDATFRISVVQFQTTVICTDNGSGADTLLLGAAGGATDGIDTAFGESERPPKPAFGTFDARWSILSSLGSSVDIRDTLSPAHAEAVYRCELQPGPGGYPMTISWGVLGAGVWTLRDGATHGGLFTLPMRSLGACVISDPSVASVEIVHGAGVTQTASVSALWNIVSLPLLVDNAGVQAVFPGAGSPAYSYSGSGYLQHDSLETGRGYWIKFPAPQDVLVTGGPVAAETLSLGAGWNMIGAITAPVDTGSIITIPPGILSSGFFGFTNGAYTVADSLLPARGYWVKLREAGQVVVSSSSVARSVAGRAPRVTAQSELNTLTIAGRDGIEHTLYFGEGEAEGEHAHAIDGLPLAPPVGIFDVRFASQRDAEIIPAGDRTPREFPIVIQSGVYPLSVRWEVKRPGGLRYVLRDADTRGRIGVVPLSGSGEILIRDPGVTQVILHVEASKK